MWLEHVNHISHFRSLFYLGIYTAQRNQHNPFEFLHRRIFGQVRIKNIYYLMIRHLFFYPVHQINLQKEHNIVHRDSPGDKLHYQSPEAMDIDFFTEITRLEAGFSLQFHEAIRANRLSQRIHTQES